MKRYEVMYIVDPANEEGIDEVKKKVEGIITGREGAIVSFEKLGKKRLAYSIDKRQYGVYYLIDLKGDARIVQALDYFLRMSPIVLRFIILAFSDKELRLKEETERIQSEEAERMRQGGRPLPGGGHAADDESSDGDSETADTESDESETEPAEEPFGSGEGHADDSDDGGEIVEKKVE